MKITEIIYYQIYLNIKYCFSPGVGNSVDFGKFNLEKEYREKIIFDSKNKLILPKIWHNN